MKSSKALARKILCGLLAAGVVGMSGSALAAESKPNEAVAGEDKNVNATYSDGKISGVYYGLKATGDAVLAECAVRDCIWGVGLSMTDPKRLEMEKWRGQNLLGFALMMVRDGI